MYFTYDGNLFELMFDIFILSTVGLTCKENGLLQLR